MRRVVSSQQRGEGNAFQGSTANTDSGSVRRKRAVAERTGARCGITQSTLNNIVNGRNNSITIQTVLRICRGLGMELQEFFDDDLFRDIEQEIY